MPAKTGPFTCDVETLQRVNRVSAQRVAVINSLIVALDPGRAQSL